MELIPHPRCIIVIMTNSQRWQGAQDKSFLSRIFSAREVKHGLSIFTDEEINAIENLITEKDGRLYIRCQITGRDKIAKPEEIVRQLWIYRLMNR